MSKETTIYYGDKLIASFNAGQTATLTTGGDKLKHDIVVKAGGDVPEPDYGDWQPIGDGNTHLWVNLDEYRKSPTLGVCVNGTVSVDWGDGTAPSILTGTTAEYVDSNSVKWASHNYAAGGDYIITLIVDGELGFWGETGNYYSFLLRASKSNHNGNSHYISRIINVEFGNGISNLAGYVLGGCRSLRNVVIPETITKIGIGSFYHCASLKSIHLPNSLTEIGKYAFQYCSSLEEINIPDKVVNVGQSAFSDCRRLRKVKLPDELVNIESYTFSGCSCLEEINIPKKLTTIGDKAFSSCVFLKSIHLPDGVTEIGTNAFYQCNLLEEINIPDGITSIKDYTFYMCYQLRNIIIPKTVTTIGNYAFLYCYPVTNIKFPKSVISIGSSAFMGLSGCILYDFTEHEVVPTLASSSIFEYMSPDCKIRVPAALVDEWKAATNWSTYASKIVGV